MNIAIVTGASSGMGREFVLQLGAYTQVDEIWVIARRAEALEALKAEVSTPLRILSLDLCENESFHALDALLQEEKPKAPMELMVVKDFSVFLDTVEQATELMKLAGIKTSTKVKENDEELVCTIRIKKKNFI